MTDVYQLTSTRRLSCNNSSGELWFQCDPRYEAANSFGASFNSNLISSSLQEFATAFINADNVAISVDAPTLGFETPSIEKAACIRIPAYRMASKPRLRAVIPGAGRDANTEQQAQSRSHKRFSWAETPIEMKDPRERPFEAQLSSRPAPIAVPIAETSQQERDQSQAMRSSQPRLQQQETEHTISAQQQPQTHYQGVSGQEAAQPILTTSIPRSRSPYNIPEPTNPHPALFAPIVSNGSQDPPHRPGSIPLEHAQDQSQPLPDAAPVSKPPQTQADAPSNRHSTQKLPPPSSQPTRDFAQPKREPTQPYSPTTVAPLRSAPALPHQPGQIAHPNMALAGRAAPRAWAHRLCECSADVATCLEGSACPCVLDGRTAYRLDAKDAHRDPTDLLGFERCNARCVLFACSVPCGLHCRFVVAWPRGCGALRTALTVL